jgi:hypothetical protein
VSDLYIPTTGPPILLQQNRRTDHGNILSTTTTKITRVEEIEETTEMVLNRGTVMSDAISIRVEILTLKETPKIIVVFWTG